MRLLIVTALVLLAALSLPVSAQQAESLNVGASASAQCDQKRVRIDWTVTNLEDKAVSVTVTDEQHDKQSPAVSVAPAETVTSSFSTNAKATNAATLAFVFTPSDSEKQTLKEVSYEAITCDEDEEEPETPPAAQNRPQQTETPDGLPTTGPLDGIALYVAATLAFGSAWLVTKRELVETLKSK